MVPLTAVLLAGAALIDHCRTRRARIAVLAAVTASAAMMSVVATVDRLTDWSWPFPGDARFAGGTRFVSFGYHGNAAAFLELGLPAAILLAITIRPRAAALRLAVLGAPAVILVGAAVNVSKLGQLLALVLVIAGAAVALRDRRIAGSVDRRRFAACVIVGLCIVGVGAFAARDRWQELPDALGRDSGRALTWEVAARTAGRSPVFGTGPGGYKLYLQPVTAAEVPELFKHSIVTPYRDGQPVTIWMQVHDDPLQTVAEWGPLAAAALAVVVLWPLAKCAVVALRSRGRAVGPTMAALALTAVYVHSLVDFPLQVLALQLTIAAWAAVALGEADVSRRATRARHETGDADAGHGRTTA
ncbi:MAG: O-antigen ligase family protein, partial [Acidimicrobiales bacterium]